VGVLLDLNNGPQKLLPWQKKPGAVARRTAGTAPERRVPQELSPRWSDDPPRGASRARAPRHGKRPFSFGFSPQAKRERERSCFSRELTRTTDGIAPEIGIAPKTKLTHAVPWELHQRSWSCWEERGKERGTFLKKKTRKIEGIYEEINANERQLGLLIGLPKAEEPTTSTASSPSRFSTAASGSTPTTSTLTEHTALPRHRRHPPPQHTAL
jgi:hypothetical protein